MKLFVQTQAIHEMPPFTDTYCGCKIYFFRCSRTDNMITETIGNEYKYFQCEHCTLCKKLNKKKNNKKNRKQSE